METFTSELYARMQVQLEDIAHSSDDLLFIAEQSYNAVLVYLKELKDFTKDYVFKDLEEEIHFFKELKPSFLKEIIYFMKIYNIESAKPVGSRDTQKKHYEDWTGQLHSFFEQNKFFYLYYRTEKTYLDGDMFVRYPKELPLMPNYGLDADPEFSNVYSYKKAKILAYEDLISFLQTQIHGNNAFAERPETKPRHQLVYRHSNAQAIELTYALWKSGAFGEVTIKEAFEWAQYFFNKKITNYYGYFQSMRIRKKNRAPYIDLLKDYLIRHMDENDEYPRTAF